MRVARICLCVLAYGGACAQQFVVSTYAGGGAPPTSVAALNAGIGFPQNLATDTAGNVYFANLNCVFKLDRNGVLNRIAGNSLPGLSGDGGPALDAQIFLSANRPMFISDPNYHGGVAVDSAGNIYIADTGNNRIRKVSNGIIMTIAGNGKFASSGDGGPAADAQLFWPIAMAADGAGNLFVSENFGRVRKISPDGIISTVAGGGTNAPGDGGIATNAQLALVVGVAADGKGNLYLADRDAGRIRKVSTDGIITTVAGGGANSPGDGGPATGAALYAPSSVAVDGAGNVYFSDYNPKIDDWVVFKVSTDGTISMLVALYASAMATDSDGNLYLARSGFLSRVSPAGTVTTVAGNGTLAPYYSGDGGAATAAQLNTPWGVAVDSTGNVYIADSFNNRVRKVSADGTITTAVGNGAYGYSGDGGKAIDALLSGPVALAVDAADNLYIADLNNNAIRKVSATGMITTVAGNGAGGYSGDGGPAVSARLFNPRGVAVDRDGNLYIADYYNRRVRKVSPDGMITTVAGNGGAGYTGDGGPATSAQVVADAVAVDSAGALYLPYNSVIRKVSPDGMITTVAGTVGSGYSGDGGPATRAGVSATGMAIDGAGNWYIADSGNHRIRKVSPDGIITTIAGTGSYGYTGDGGPALSAQLGEPFALAIDSAGNVYVADRYYSVVRRLQPIGSSSPGNQ